ncbi:NAD(P)-binding protein [Pikeienuella piscinae]|uniref:NAD(P)-binding protein n=1 Tax=Pikeienuella piscinae TaxID=2748098 RepID=A0A7L5BUL7_9RHOB|nr:FAD-dependent oxidoreductase [Pikeienuella piscinae]QIE55970.1 NAD(P)-binding protein [Pikeienuella piscinae]
MKIAVVGSGAAGLGAALALSDRHEVLLFEKSGRFGGHANTVVAEVGDERVAVDTGFIVYNDANYPNLSAMFEHLGTPTGPSDMSFGFSLDAGRFEYACDNLDKIFAQRLNAFNPRFINGFRDVMRFVKLAPTDLASGALSGLTLGEWLTRRRFGAWFRERFILPMGGAIWSTPAARMLEFPAANFVSFFANHDLFTGLAAAMQWRTVTGGAKTYVDAIIDHLSNRAHRGVGVSAARRVDGKVELSFEDGSEGLFDHVVFAAHAPQSFAIATDLDPRERALLGAFRTTANRAVLHRDESLMPRRRKVWSSWSMLFEGETLGVAGQPVTLTYWMNRLQNLPTDRDFFVTLNGQREPDPALTIAAFDYQHPAYDEAAFAAQARMDEIQGQGGYWYAGAWLGWGFHEDALRTGLRVAEALDARPPWARDLGPSLTREFDVAAE